MSTPSHHDRQESGEKGSDPDFSLEVVNDLYQDRPRQLEVATVWALIGGIFGAHRFYCRKTLSGWLMLFSAGGGLFWWIWDLFHLRELVDDCNGQERARLDAGLPPSNLAFLPPRDQLRLHEPPRWAAKRAGRGRVLGSALMLALTGYTLGVISHSTSMYEPVLILLIFVVVTLLAARWNRIHDLPLLNSPARWAHRLRLYYQVVDPGNLWLLATRPLIGLLFLPWQPRARAEVRLYLQFGLVLALPFAGIQLVQLMQSGGFWSGFGLLVSDFLLTMLFTYLFVAPAGALLTTQLLLARKDYVIWVLTAILVYSVYVGVLTVS